MVIHMVRTQIQLTEKQSEALKKLARRKKVSVAELIRQSISFLLRPGIEADLDDYRREARQIAGRYHSGHKDISEKHDEHLMDIYK